MEQGAVIKYGTDKIKRYRLMTDVYLFTAKKVPEAFIMNLFRHFCFLLNFSPCSFIEQDEYRKNLKSSQHHGKGKNDF